jgi:co-chaperonin GroES (HSP10)
MTTLKATGHRYIIRAEELNYTTASGIVLKSSNDTQFAKICSVGGDVKDPLPVGTKIVVDWGHTVPLKHENVQYFVIDSRAVAAVVEED